MVSFLVILIFFIIIIIFFFLLIFSISPSSFNDTIDVLAFRVLHVRGRHRSVENEHREDAPFGSRCPSERSIRFASEGSD